ncbi:DUF397 domain-containing protein [Streptomyces rimosus]|uniref:DUF397 domain-containing protein n=1 Tax=Streptomyces rimosus TaxID=1927 RepID=UPI000D1494F2|nr:DUF397 domain-containing protein [Streptomyces rimosus]
MGPVHREVGGNLVSDHIWCKSSYSDDVGGECVEISTGPGVIRVRDSEDPKGPQLDFDVGAWTAFLAYARERPA